MSTCNLDSYTCSDEGLLMPFVNEYTWLVEVRAVIYLLGLLWSFMGVSIIADIFMQSIEVITRSLVVLSGGNLSSRRTCDLVLSGLEVEFDCIYLFMYPTVIKQIFQVELVYNFIIFIRSLNFIVVSSSFPIGQKGGVELVHSKADKAVVVDVLKKMGKRPDLSEEDEARITTAFMAKRIPHNRAWYRINAIRNLTGGHKLVPNVTEKQREILKTIENGEDVGSTVSLGFVPNGGNKAVFEWAAAATAVLERDKHATLVILRHGNVKLRAFVRVETIGGTAEAGSDYKHIKKTVVFEPGETTQEVQVEIVDDNEWEPDEVFFVRLTVDPEEPFVLGTRPICEVTIVNDDDPGMFEFAKPSFVFKESAGKALVEVKRLNGCDGRASVHWTTRDQTGENAAVAGRDYQAASGDLVFEHGELSKTIEIEITDDQDYEKDEHFDLELTSCSEGAKLGHLKKTVVTILNDDEFQGVVSRIVDLTNANLDQISVGKSSWGKQLKQAMNVNGGDMEAATTADYVMHFLTFGWKVIFALIPPTHIWGGWLAFFVSLAMIGILTALVGDLASIFGCLIGLKPTVTAITFVALGTSLPDLFASMQAAKQEEHADNSIGNVTGSNSVNVFLGLGLPWTIAAIKWSIDGTTFEVPAGNLAFSVTLYTVCAIVTIAILMLRRSIKPLGGAELGGPKVPKTVSAIIFVFLWFFYVLLSSLQAYEYVKADF
ncbi:sodium/calcium exchanger 2 [Aplysia californica]|uniref:Sodium/calcium exchanger 2 n=1 Tax=Aplysia californica TaxID=6500 RepID=A0ABM0ZW65_APLCA|nr:sodium/calcium exchanger 2 [Aplysia californica]